jgi:hypothetical protein
MTIAHTIQHPADASESFSRYAFPRTKNTAGDAWGQSEQVERWMVSAVSDERMVKNILSGKEKGKSNVEVLPFLVEGFAASGSSVGSAGSMWVVNLHTDVNDG